MVHAPCERIGHGGASALAPANTLSSFDAALEVGVDMVEFDVREWRGELVLAHTVLHARRGRTVRLGDALAHLAGRRFADVGLNVDVKHVGCEAALLDGLREREPRVRLGISVGGRVARFSRRWGDWRAHVLSGLASRRWDALMAQHRLVDAALLEHVITRDGRLYAWTVNERAAIQSLRGLGVHGIATADPRLFTPVTLAASP